MLSDFQSHNSKHNRSYVYQCHNSRYLDSTVINPYYTSVIFLQQFCFHFQFLARRLHCFVKHTYIKHGQQLGHCDTIFSGHFCIAGKNTVTLVIQRNFQLYQITFPQVSNAVSSTNDNINFQLVNTNSNGAQTSGSVLNSVRLSVGYPSRIPQPTISGILFNGVFVCGIGI